MAEPRLRKREVVGRSFDFIDLFAGCGGLSLGLANAGWTGRFAVERNPSAFETLKHNLVDHPEHSHYSWPTDWLSPESLDIREFLAEHEKDLKKLKKKVKLVAGGPPCQGFSMAGRRKDKRL